MLIQDGSFEIPGNTIYIPITEETQLYGSITDKTGKVHLFETENIPTGYYIEALYCGEINSAITPVQVNGVISITYERTQAILEGEIFEVGDHTIGIHIHVPTIPIQEDTVIYKYGHLIDISEIVIGDHARILYNDGATEEGTAEYVFKILIE